MSSTTMPEIMTLAPAVAAELGPDWTCAPDEKPYRFWISTAQEGQGRGRGSAYVSSSREGRGIRLFVDPYASGRGIGRVHVHGRRPEAPGDVVIDDADISFGRISVAGTKQPRQIAAEIRRRLLPQLDAGVVTWRERVEAERAKDEQARALALRLASVTGTTPTEHARGSGPVWHLMCSVPFRSPERGTEPEAARAVVNVTGDADGPHVRIELSQLNGAQAQQVLRALEADAAQPEPSS
ncbi:hypothetical protein [Streptomyces parvus]|uniref:hypothetical protein n=1 Tax=Streptomyces parvus TaxID=66428 RepID=UPI002100DA98|nr:hypothetical protein [Streptomyces parvus]MCQ1581230.1 hypothetical protein [Streptomyces parvus]